MANAIAELNLAFYDSNLLIAQANTFAIFEASKSEEPLSLKHFLPPQTPR